ncbi:hypothetical protein BC830DRAFT_1158177 [Chytriomyces sp. MP71]|nr:hypothetical protein BC830DRAFT_1158177 [Chytriomyces sp. MP71]
MRNATHFPVGSPTVLTIACCSFLAFLRVRVGACDRPSYQQSTIYCEAQNSALIKVSFLEIKEGWEIFSLFR